MARISLRERNKRIRAEQVLDAAAQLFEERGYEGTHIEAIAEQALVAPATVYNYFATKPNLLMALALRHVRAALPERRQFIQNLPAEPLDGVLAFERLLAEQAMRYMSRESYRVIMSSAYVETGGPTSRTGARLNKLIERHYVRMFVNYQQAGRIAPHIDPALLAEVIVGVTTHLFGTFVASSTQTMDSLLNKIAEHVELILSGVVVPASKA